MGVGGGGGRALSGSGSGSGGRQRLELGLVDVPLPPSPRRTPCRPADSTACVVDGGSVLPPAEHHGGAARVGGLDGVERGRASGVVVDPPRRPPRRPRSPRRPGRHRAPRGRTRLRLAHEPGAGAGGSGAGAGFGATGAGTGRRRHVPRQVRRLEHDGRRRRPAGEARLGPAVQQRRRLLFAHRGERRGRFVQRHGRRRRRLGLESQVLRGLPKGSSGMNAAARVSDRRGRGRRWRRRRTRGRGSRRRPGRANGTTGGGAGRRRALRRARQQVLHLGDQRLAARRAWPGSRRSRRASRALLVEGLEGAGQQQHGHVREGRVLLDVVADLVAVLLRHDDVAQHDVRTDLGELLERRAGRCPR